jgi:hypothetical protein
MKINLGSIQIPINGATKTIAILAKRGAGKSYTGAVMAEELHKNNVPFVVFDPIDVWWGLRLAKDGKSKGLPVVVFGLEHADILLTRDMGREIAQAIVQENVSCVISTFGMPKVAQRHLIAGSCTSCLRIIPLASKPGKMPPSSPVLEGAMPWSRLFFTTNSPYAFSCGSSSCCTSRGPSQVCLRHPCRRSPSATAPRRPKRLRA